MSKFGAPVKHLLVDLDGTLLESRTYPLRFSFTIDFLRTMRKHGGWLKAVRALLAVQRAFETPATELSGEMTNDRRAAAALARELGLTVEEGAHLLDETVFHIFPRLERHFYPVPGAREFIAWARGKFPLTLATNPVWPEELVRLRLKWAGVDPAHFESITHARVMHACKPTPEYYQQVLAQKGLRAEDCLLIGDDLRKDLPATHVGIRTFILSRRQGSEQILRWPASAWTGSFAALREMLA